MATGSRQQEKKNSENDAQTKPQTKQKSHGVPWLS
jgi:hypothetical protein